MERVLITPKEDWIHIVKQEVYKDVYGLKGEITVNDEIYDGVMANQGLEEEEIADVMNYILNQWGNQSEEFITPQQVAAVPKSILQK